MPRSTRAAQRATDDHATTAPVMPPADTASDEPASPHARARKAPASPPTPAALPLDGAANGIPASMFSLAQLSSVLESLLFVAGRPLEFSELRKILLVDDRRLRAALDTLANDCERNGRGIRVQRLNDQAQLVSAPEHSRFVAALLGLPTQAKLTTAALETLSVIAYRQPITRSQIEFIRGVNSDRALVSLLQYGLVIEVGRAATVGRPALFGTTAEFLQQFGLPSLDALPRPDLPQADAVEARHDAAVASVRHAINAGEDTDAATNQPTTAQRDTPQSDAD